MNRRAGFLLQLDRLPSPSSTRLLGEPFLLHSTASQQSNEHKLVLQICQVFGIFRSHWKEAEVLPILIKRRASKNVGNSTGQQSDDFFTVSRSSGWLSNLPWHTNESRVWIAERLKPSQRPKLGGQRNTMGTIYGKHANQVTEIHCIAMTSCFHVPRGPMGFANAALDACTLN